MNLESLLAPLLRRICEYCAFKRAGYEVPYEVMMEELSSELSSLSLQCSSSPLLRERWRRIEKPLIFFIDYTIKEGGFSFSERYQELARSYNELSGDDKFFDLLDAALRQGDDRELVRLFYLFLGLGFDGAYKRERSETMRLMAEVKAQLELKDELLKSPLCPGLDLKAASGSSPQQSRRVTLKKTLAVLGAAAVISCVINAFCLSSQVDPFESAVEQAALSARPYVQ